MFNNRRYQPSRTVGQVILNQTRDRISESDSNQIKAQKLFEVFLDFIQKYNWSYKPERPQLDVHRIFNTPFRRPQEVNCYDLTELFLSLCRSLGIENATKVEVYNKPIVFNTEFSPLSPVAKPFDNNLLSYVDDEAIYTCHSYAKVDKQFFDITFSTYYFEANAPFVNTLFGKTIEAIHNKDEDLAFDLVRTLSMADLFKTFHGWSLSHHCAEKGLINLLRYLLNRGLDANASTKEENPLSLFVLLQNNITTENLSDIVKMLEPHLDSHVIEYSLFELAIRIIHNEDHANIIDAILTQSDKMVHYQDNGGFTLLHWAYLNNRLETIVTLIEYGANVDIQDNQGNTPLNFCQWDLDMLQSELSLMG